MYYKNNIKNVEASDVRIGNSQGIKIQWLITNKQEKSYAIRRFVFKAGAKMPLHYHDYVESLYILKGKCRICVENNKMDMKEGDFIFIDSKEKHEIYNDNNEELVFLCVIDYPENMDIKTVDDDCFKIL